MRKLFALIALLALAQPVAAQGAQSSFDCNSCYLGNGYTATLTIQHGVGGQGQALDHTFGVTWSQAGGAVQAAEGRYSWRSFDWHVVGFPGGQTGGSNTGWDSLNCQEGYAGAAQLYFKASNPTINTRNAINKYAQHWHNCDHESGGGMW